MATLAEVPARVRELFRRAQAGELQAEDVLSPGEVYQVSSANQAVGMLHAGAPSDPDLSVFARLPNDGTILDVGAHWGYSAVNLRLYGCRHPILSFEPEPQNFPSLDALKRQLPDYDYSPYALSFGAQELKVYVPTVNRVPLTAMGSVDAQALQWHDDYLVSLAGWQYPTAESYDVRLMASTFTALTLDDALTTFKRRYSVPVKSIVGIKLDVECHEAAVLQGAEETFRTHRPLLMVESGNRDPLVKTLMTAYGYKYAERDGNQLYRTDELCRGINGYWVHTSNYQAYAKVGLLKQ